MKKTAIILGATGLTGGLVLQRLLKDDRYEQVKLFSRSPINITHSKLQEYLVDLFHLDLHHEEFTGHEVYCCIGTTKSKTPNKRTYRKIDYGIPIAAARLCKRNNIQKFMVISAMGANVRSRIFYNRLKGEMEREVLNEKPHGTFILRPSLISGKREEWRLGEFIFKNMMNMFSFMLMGSLEKYRPISPEQIARAMIWLGNNEYMNRIIESDTIKELAHKHDHD